MHKMKFIVAAVALLLVTGPAMASIINVGTSFGRLGVAPVSQTTVVHTAVNPANGHSYHLLGPIFYVDEIHNWARAGGNLPGGANGHRAGWLAEGLPDGGE